MFHEEPNGALQAYDARTGTVLWQFQTGEVGLGGGAGPSASAAMAYAANGRQYIAVANNRAVWAFAIGGSVPARPAPTPPAIVREWAGRVEDTTTIQLGAVRTFTIAAANKKIDWTNDYDIAPTRARARAGTPVTFVNQTPMPHAIEARDGSWRTGIIKPGDSGTVTIAKPGTYEYVCRDHPWSIGQLTIE